MKINTTTDFDTLLNTLAALKEELGTKPADLVFDVDPEAKPRELSVELRMSIVGGKVTRQIVIGA